MITVQILINGKAIFVRSAVNRGYCDKSTCRYEVDDGSAITHKPADGAVKLAIQLLQTIKEPR